MVETIFAVAIVRPFLGDDLVTAGAALTTWTIGIVYYQLMGWWFLTIPIFLSLFFEHESVDHRSIHVAQSKMGRFLYGAAYGLTVFPLWSVLQAFGRPLLHNYYDTGYERDVFIFQRMGASLGILPSWSWAVTTVSILVWVVSFLALRPGLIDHPGGRGRLWLMGWAARLKMSKGRRPIR